MWGGQISSTPAQISIRSSHLSNSAGARTIQVVGNIDDNRTVIDDDNVGGTAEVVAPTDDDDVLVGGDGEQSSILSSDDQFVNIETSRGYSLQKDSGKMVTVRRNNLDLESISFILVDKVNKLKCWELWI